MSWNRRCVIVLALVVLTGRADAAERVLEPTFHHLRSGQEREWSEFEEVAEGTRWTLRFEADGPNRQERTLRLRHRDVKRGEWTVALNGTSLGDLPRDERDMVLALAVPVGTLVAGENVLEISSRVAIPSDDILVGDVRLLDSPVEQWLNEARVRIEVTDGETGDALPCRISIADAQGWLSPVGAASDDRRAARTDLIYTADGTAEFGLPAGEFTVYANRGFEYSADSVRLQLQPGDRLERRLSIRREVDTPGWVSCDTHIHTLEHSGHGDASDEERVISIAGEGLELAISTEHNKHIDYAPVARRLGVDRYFTTIVGNEVTTKIGHFNAFPMSVDEPAPDVQAPDWAGVFANIFRGAPNRAVVLNHPRDVHGGYTPFAPKNFNAATAAQTSGWRLEAHALEAINSAAMQSDMMQAYRDWFALLNRGFPVTVVGASDSHEVGYKIVAQARTYLECPDDDPGRIDPTAAVASLRAGRAMVSYGLLAEIGVDDHYGPGETASFATSDGTAHVTVRVMGPSWAAAEHVALYVNGRLAREATIDPDARNKPGEKWRDTWTLGGLKHDAHVVAIVDGPGVREPFWQVRKPYQPTSLDWEPRIMGSSGVVWLDVDGDGRAICARDYAERIVEQASGDLARLVSLLAGHDRAVAAQAADLLASHGTSPLDSELVSALRSAEDETRQGFSDYRHAWRATQRAQAE